jgi:transposase
MRFDEVKVLAAKGFSHRAIARQLQMHRETVARFLQLDELPERALPPQNTSTVTPYLDYMRQHWKEGCHNGKQLWREIRAQGYTGSYMSVYRVLKRFRSSVDNQHSTDLSPTVPVLSPRKAQWLLTHEPKQLTAEQLIQLTALCERCPDAATAYPLAQRFARMIRERRVEDLDPWLNDALACGLPFLHNFAIGLNRDYDAVKAALRLKWSNGQVEGQVNRLKVIKRIMYGRAKFDLLRLRVLHPP